jgi:hypothetical protein
VQISGSLAAAGNDKFHSIVFRVGGYAAAHGTITISTGARASGALEGRRFAVSIATAKLSRAADTGSALAAAWSASLPGVLRTGFPPAEVARLR